MRKRRSINAKLKRRSINAKFDTIIRNARGPPSFAPPEAATTDKTASQASKQALFDYLGLPSNADTYSRQGVARSSGGALRTVQRSLVREQVGQGPASRKAPLPQRAQELIDKLFRPLENLVENVAQQHSSSTPAHQQRHTLSFAPSNLLPGGFDNYGGYVSEGYPYPPPQHDHLTWYCHPDAPHAAFQASQVVPPQRISFYSPDGRRRLPAEYARRYHPYASFRPQGAQRYLQLADGRFYQHEEALYEYPPAPILRSRVIPVPHYNAEHDEEDGFGYDDDVQVSDCHLGPCSCPDCPSHAPLDHKSTGPRHPVAKQQLVDRVDKKRRRHIEEVDESLQIEDDAMEHSDGEAEDEDEESTGVLSDATQYDPPPPARVPSTFTRSQTNPRSQQLPKQTRQVAQNHHDEPPTLTPDTGPDSRSQGIESEVDHSHSASQTSAAESQAPTFSASDNRKRPQQHVTHSRRGPLVPSKRGQIARALRTEPSDAPSSQRPPVHNAQSQPHAVPLPPPSPTISAEKHGLPLKDAPWTHQPNNVVQMLEKVVNRSSSPVSSESDDEYSVQASTPTHRRESGDAAVIENQPYMNMAMMTPRKSDDEQGLSSPMAGPMSIDDDDDEPFEYDDEVIQTPLPTHIRPRELQRASEHAWAVLAASLPPRRSDPYGADPVERDMPAPPSPALAPVDSMPSLEDEVESISLFSDADGDNIPGEGSPRPRSWRKLNQQPLFDPPPLSLADDPVNESFDPTPPSPPPPKPVKHVRWADQQPRFADPGFEIWREGY